MQLYIHIGLPKTGVTLLSQIFESSKNINFLGRPLISIFDEIWQSMIFDNNKKFKKKTILLKNEIINSLSQNKKNVLLIEGISDVFFVLNSKKNFLKRLELLRKVLGNKVNFKIIFSIRNQSEFFISRYVESPQFFQDYNNDWKNFKKFRDSLRKKKYSLKEKKFFNYFNYFKICSDLFKIFDKKNVHIFLYEDLKFDKKKFAKQISKIFKLNFQKTYEFININRFNKSTSFNDKIFVKKTSQSYFLLTNNKIYIKLHRKIPRNIKTFFKKIFNFFDKLYYSKFLQFKPEQKIYFNNTDIKLIKKFYYKNNKKVDNIFKIGLKKYNYY